MKRLVLDLGVVVFGTTCWAQVTQRVSLDSSGAQGADESGVPSISADGRLVAFASNAANLVPGDLNHSSDVFLRDRQTGTTVCVSVDPNGAPGLVGSFSPAISANGRYVAFMSYADNLVPGDDNLRSDIFVRDLQTGSTERVSVDSNGVQGNDSSGRGSCPAISADGRYVAFSSDASNLVPGDTNAFEDTFVRDRVLGTTERVSVDSAGAEANYGSGRDPAISADGRFVAFASISTNLASGDTGWIEDVFLHDRLIGTTERVSVDTAGVQGNDDSEDPSISPDGRYVVFESDATNLVPVDNNGAIDVFLRDRLLATTELVARDSSGTQGNNRAVDPTISDDGRYVAFTSWSSNLVAGDTNGAWDDFVRDRVLGITERTSVDSSGAGGNTRSLAGSISGDGRYVAFRSYAVNLVPGDTNGVSDVFVRDRAHAGFASLCDPGVAGVIACPCSNPPSGPGRGCDNSSGTGGASLAASGGEYLSSDSVVFTTSGGKPTALHVVLQGVGSLPAGAIYGQGVRCVAGSLKRLYAKAAVAGSITAPDFGAGDATVHARSAALGDVIAAGSTRWYMVFYRDPTVLGGCSASSTFNTTQTRELLWQP